MISEFLSKILEAVDNISQRFYADLADGLAATLYSIAVIIFIMLVVNYMFQIKQFTFGAYVGWIIRVVIIITAATSWAAYEPIYNALRNIPNNISQSLLGGSDIFVSLDDMILSGFDIAANSFEQGSWDNLPPYIIGGVIWLVSAFLGAIGMFIGATAHIGLALSLGLAPIFISALLLESTAQLFASWTKFVIGFIVTLIVLAGVIAITSGVFEEVVEQTSVEGDLASWGSLIVAIIVSCFFLMSIPSLSSTLAGGVVTAGTGFAQASGALNSVKSATREATNAATAPVRAGQAAHRTYNKGRELQQKFQKKAQERVAARTGGGKS